MSFGFALDVTVRFVCTLSRLICKITVICNKYLIKTLAKPCGAKFHNETKCLSRNSLFQERKYCFRTRKAGRAPTPKNSIEIYDRDWSCLCQIMIFDLILQSSNGLFHSYVQGKIFPLNISMKKITKYDTFILPAV